MSAVALGGGGGVFWLYFCHCAAGTNLDDSLTACQADPHGWGTAPSIASVGRSEVEKEDQGFLHQRGEHKRSFAIKSSITSFFSGCADLWLSPADQMWGRGWG